MALGRIGESASCDNCREADCAGCEEILTLVDECIEANGDYASIDYRDRQVPCLCFDINRPAHWAQYFKE